MSDQIYVSVLNHNAAQMFQMPFANPNQVMRRYEWDDPAEFLARQMQDLTLRIRQTRYEIGLERSAIRELLHPPSAIQLPANSNTNT